MKTDKDTQLMMEAYQQVSQEGIQYPWDAKPINPSERALESGLKAQIKSSKRRDEIFNDLREQKAISPETAQFVFGVDYRLAVKMAQEGILGTVSNNQAGIYDKSNIGLKDPQYKFYIK